MLNTYGFSDNVQIFLFGHFYVRILTIIYKKTILFYSLLIEEFIMSSLPSLLMIGCGHMGKAMLKGWIKKGLNHSFIVNRHDFDLVTPHQLAHTIQDVPKTFQPEAVVLAVKPDQAAELIPHLKPWCKNIPVISVLGGKTLAWLQQQFGDHQSIIRVMPNTPSELGLGMTSMISNSQTQSNQKQIAERLFNAIGKTAWLDTEQEIDIATAIAGCGPAYIFLLAELLQKIGQEKGLSEDLARLLARQTVIGSAALLNHSREEAETLRKNVATPNGITEQAVNVLIQPDAWPHILSKALQAAADRSRALSS